MKSADQATECLLQPACDQEENKETEDGCRQKKNGIGPDDIEDIAMGFVQRIGGQPIRLFADRGDDGIEIFKIAEVPEGFSGFFSLPLCHQFDRERCCLGETVHFRFQGIDLSHHPCHFQPILQIIAVIFASCLRKCFCLFENRINLLLAFFRAGKNLLNPLLRGGSFIRQTVGNNLDFVGNDIQGVETGENRQVILENSPHFLVGILDQIKGRCQSTSKENQKGDDPSHDLGSEGVAHEE